MKKYFSLLLIGFLAAAFFSDPCFSALITPLEDGKDYSLEGSLVKLHFTERSPQQEDPGQPKSLNFEIFTKADESVGNISLTWYPEPRNAPISFSGSSFLFIENIYIGTERVEGEPHLFQKKGYGTSAMKTLFVLLRKSGQFPKETEIILECPTYVDHLARWYRSLGFSDISREGSLKQGSQYMSGLLRKIVKISLQDLNRSESIKA